jgi:hypothetical protein
MKFSQKSEAELDFGVHGKKSWLRAWTLLEVLTRPSAAQNEKAPGRIFNAAQAQERRADVGSFEFASIGSSAAIYVFFRWIGNMSAEVQFTEKGTRSSRCPTGNMVVLFEFVFR